MYQKFKILLLAGNLHVRPGERTLGGILGHTSVALGPPTLRQSFLGVESLAQGLSPHTLGPLLRIFHTCPEARHSDGISPLPRHLLHGLPKPWREGALAGRGGPGLWVAPCRWGAGRGVRRVRCKPQPDPRAASRPWPRAWYQGSAPGGPRSARRGPGSQPLIRQRPLSRKAFNVVRWYFSGCFSERKS